MTHAIACPQCSAPLPISAHETFIRCPYCGSAVQVASAPESTNSAHDPLLPDPSLTEVAMLLRAGKRVQATVRYREITGASLKGARQALDQFVAGEPLRRPNRMHG